jgi:hypothetical protein
MYRFCPELDENVTADYFLMESYVNEEKAWNGHLKVIRSLNILYPPSLESIQIGQYTKMNQNVFFTGVEYDSETHMVSEEYRDSYVTSINNNWLPKLLDTDLVEMADGTFKTALDLRVDDVIKTIDIPNPNGTDNSSYTANFGITYETLTSGTTYSTNRITNLKRVNKLTYIYELTFEDESTWEDTGVSSYLIERDGIVQFDRLFDIKIGDVVLLLNTSDGLVDFTRKTVVSNVELFTRLKSAPSKAFDASLEYVKTIPDTIDATVAAPSVLIVKFKSTV